jgi:hypothetical protein
LFCPGFGVVKAFLESTYNWPHLVIDMPFFVNPLVQNVVDRRLNLEVDPPVGPVNNPNITLKIEL